MTSHTVLPKGLTKSCVALLALTSGASAQLTATAAPDGPQRGLLFAHTPIVEGGAIERSPLSFIENRGQFHRDVLYRSSSGPMLTWLTRDELVLDLYRRRDDVREGVIVRLRFEGASPQVQVNGDDKRSYPLHYLIGPEHEWKRDVPSFAAVDYRGLYPGIDMRVKDSRGNVEYDLLLSPGAELDRVVMRVDGVDRLEVAADGSLRMKNSFADLIQLPPKCWHVTAAGSKHFVDCRFELIDGQRYRFVVDGRDPARSLVVDPILTWATYMGGDADDRSIAVVRSPNGQVTICGDTLTAASVPFPVKPKSGPYRTYGGGLSDAFVSRFDPSKSGNAQLVWSLYLGGNASDLAIEMALGPGGVTWVTGWSGSTNFPLTANAYQRANRGQQDAFVTAILPAGNALLYSTYYGGAGREWANAIHVDTAGIATIGGYTESKNLPTAGNPFQATLSPPLPPSTIGRDAFFARLDHRKPTTTQLLWGTYIGGGQLDGNTFNLTDPWNGQLLAMTVESNGVVTAGVLSHGMFPTTAGTFMPAFPGGRALLGLDSAIVVLRLDPRLRAQSQRIWATYVGGGTKGGLEWASGIAIDKGGDICVSGSTYDPKFPTTPTSFQPKPNPSNPMPNGSHDGVFFKLSGDAKRLLYGTYLGSARIGSHTSLYVESSGAAVMSGYTFGNLPASPGARFTLRAPDALVFRLKPDGQGLRDRLFLSYVGGSGGEASWDNTSAGMGISTMTGVALSQNFWRTNGAYQPNRNPNSRDSWVANIDAIHAQVDNYGAASPTCAGPIYIASDSWVRPGLTPSITCTGAPATAAGLLMLGPRIPAVVLPPVTYHVFPLIPLPVASDGRGFTRNPLPVPATIPPKFMVSFQYLWIVPSGCAVLYASNAIQVTL